MLLFCIIKIFILHVKQLVPLYWTRGFPALKAETSRIVIQDILRSSLCILGIIKASTEAAIAHGPNPAKSAVPQNSTHTHTLHVSLRGTLAVDVLCRFIAGERERALAHFRTARADGERKQAVIVLIVGQGSATRLKRRHVGCSKGV